MKGVTLLYSKIERRFNMQQKLWTKDFLLFFGSSFFIGLNFYLLMTTMALYAMQQFAASEGLAGLASSIFVIGALMARILIGGIVEKFGRKKLLYSGLSLFMIATFLYFFSNSIIVLFIVRLLNGVAFGIAHTAMNTTVMDSLPQDRRGEGTGYFSLSSTGATAIGPFIGIWLMNHYDMQVIFVVASCIAVAALLFALIATVKEADLTPEQRKAIPFSLKPDRLFAVEALPLAAVTIIMGICYSSIASFINVYAIEINLVTAASYFFIVYALFLFFSRPIAGKLLDAKGDNIVVYPAITFFALSLLCMSFANSAFMLLLAGALAAMGFGTYMSSVQVICAKVSPHHKMGLAISTFFIGLDFGVGVGPFLLGSIIPLVGYRHLYLILSLLVLCMLIVYYFIHGRTASAKKFQA